MLDKKPEKLDEKDHTLKMAPFSIHTQNRYPDAEAILDPTCTFEEQDRGAGMAVDDEKTYHRTEK